MKANPPGRVGGGESAMLTTIVELVIALLFIGLAGHILIDLWENQHEGERKNG